MMKKKLLTGVLAAVLACSMLVGCGGSGDGGGGTSGGKDGKVELRIWSSYTTASSSKLSELIAKFNARQDKYEAKLEAGLNETQTSQKLTTLDKKDFPALFMGTDRKVFEYASADYVKPIQDFIDADSEDFLSGMLESVRTAYSDLDGNLIGMPVGVSVKGYMVNLDVLAKTGYTLEDLTSFEKVVAAATAAHNKGYSQYGYIPSNGNEILDMLVYQGVDIFDGGNGYDGEITKCMLNEGNTNTALNKVLKLYAEMFESGVALENSSGQDKWVSTFTSGKSLFWSCTSSYVYEYENVNLNFKWAFMPFRGIDDNAKHQNAAMPEGTGIYIANSQDEEKMQGAYEFLKFLAEPESQLFWCTYRGYTPYTEAVLASEEWITWRDENYPSEEQLEEILRAANTELHFPNSKLVNNVAEESTTILASLIQNPKDDRGVLIQKAADSINQAIEILKLRGQ